ncbi:MAG TPA: hypothetical protein PLM89_12630, partial [Anaerolineales bacterium]|nr:hypothetical protein [Anaerolineales bacterium]
MPRTVPYGSWKSPITVDLLTAKSITLGQTALDGADIYWLEGRPLEGGRNALMKHGADGSVSECLSSAFNVRTRAHEYGGGAYAVFNGVIYFVNFKDQRVYRQKAGGVPEALTPNEGYHYADFALDRARQRLICVREDFTGGGEAVNAIVALPLEGGSNGEVLVAGADFFSTPRLSPDGKRLCWLS